jgi:2,4-dienoyl-CoA reductase-like NADH-dependent reductase (Old Yellow Enzyme family)
MMHMALNPGNDPLLQPFQLRHLRLRNRLMSTAHEPSFSEDGMPKDRYRLYHVEKAKGGIALTMTAGSAVVSPDSPPIFGNLLAYKDEIVPWMRRLADDCHTHGAAVMIQLTHLGRRTAWNKADWLPVLAPSLVREPAHRAFPKVIEDWDIERIVADYAAAAQRMEAAGLDGIEIEAYGHLLDQFWSPATNRRIDEYGGSLDNRLRFSFRVLNAVRGATDPKFIVGIRMVADEDWDIGLSRTEGIEIARRMVASGKVDFLNIIRGHMDTDAALRRVIPIHGMPAAPHLDFAGEVRNATRFPVFHAARIQDVATARHAVAAGKLDMVGMTRAHIAEPYIGRRLMEGREHEIRPCVDATTGATAQLYNCVQPIASIESMKATTPFASTIPPLGVKQACRTSSHAATDHGGRSWWLAPDQAGWRLHGLPPSVVTRLSSSRRRTNLVARYC